MTDNTPQNWDGVDRRGAVGERRRHSERRYVVERRFDYRKEAPPVRRSLKAWMRSLLKTRLGVDRRKARERRIASDRRSRELRSLLTPEELADLLQE
ncbi:MAG: hypothetical protein KKD01_16600 [Proteobacteria bacterium]|nr:hypothetical protein [Pseudomonadota bacterium]MBU1419774.1 hypothetical protein [Pseudomonadota bacterium]MBU1456346.1 hypothetical protein [Pseudomonadota bacterium]